MYNTCLQPKSYKDLPEAQEVVDFANGIDYRYEHEHRKWEYGLALKFLRETKPAFVLNVGGGSSPLSSLAKSVATYVLEVDPTPGKHYEHIDYLEGSFPNELIVSKFDVVLCTSVIEHVEHDLAFFRALLNQSDNYVFLTTDFHPSGEAQSPAHYRTYNKKVLTALIEVAGYLGFKPFGRVDYKYEVPMVYDYTFAALALQRGK